MFKSIVDNVGRITAYFADTNIRLSDIDKSDNLLNSNSFEILDELKSSASVHNNVFNSSKAYLRSNIQDTLPISESPETISPIIHPTTIQETSQNLNLSNNLSIYLSEFLETSRYRSEFDRFYRWIVTLCNTMGQFFVPLLINVLYLVEYTTQIIFRYWFIFGLIWFVKVYVNKNTTTVFKKASNLWIDFMLIVLSNAPINKVFNALALGIIILLIHWIRNRVTKIHTNTLDQDLEDTRRGSYIDIWHRLLSLCIVILNVHHLLFLTATVGPSFLANLSLIVAKHIVYWILYGSIVASVLLLRRFIRYIFDIDIRIDSVTLSIGCLFVRAYQSLIQ